LHRSRVDVASAAIAVAVLASIPFLLAFTAGWPLPTSLHGRQIWSTRNLLDLATTTAWVAWAGCSLPLCRRVVDRVRTRNIVSDGDGRVVDWFAARIATAILAVAPATLTSSQAVGAVISHNQLGASVKFEPRSATGTLIREPEQGLRRPETLSHSRAERDGQNFPSTAWYLPAQSAWAFSGENLITQTTSRHVSGIVASVSPNPGQAWLQLWRFNSRTAPSEAVTHIHFLDPRDPSFPGIALVDVPVLLSDLATIGLCCLGVSALGRRLRSKRNPCRQSPRSNLSAPEEAEPQRKRSWEAGDLETDGSPEWLCLLLGGLELEREPGGAPSVRLVRSGPDGVELVLTHEVNWAPAGWELSSTGLSWIARPDRTPEVRQTVRPREIPIVLPVGRDSSGYWAIVLEPQSSISVLGSRSDFLLATFDSLVKRPPWSKSVLTHATSDGLEFEWPGESRADSRPLRARITTRHEDEVDLTIVVDAKALTVHPQGLTLRPPEPMDLLLERTSVRPTEQRLRSIGVGSPRLSNDQVDAIPGELDVKLLTVLPWIDGLQDALPAKRARRATELVAYLALHFPDPVSSDRLRTRVLGSPDSDAAAKTLFNTVGAARRALGTDSRGDLYLPNASRYGHYKLSALVTVDVTRTARLAVGAKNADSVDESIALYRAAFDLVQGEPLAGVLSGYSWWSSEGHEARLTATIVDAACRAVRLAIGEGLLDLASWVLDKARLVDPYSELLSRAAMATAAASGDRTRLRREWDECQRRISELDPGSLPSPETKRLFDHLSRGTPMAPHGRQASLAAIDDAP
jgi:DNA-binding SARP family transcriptional activator